MIKWLLRGILALLLLVLAALVWLVASTQGANLLLRDVAPRVLPGLAVERVEGSLWRGLRVEGFVYADDATRVTLDRLGWSWHLPGLLGRRLDIARLELGHLVVALSPAETPGEQPAGALPPLPISLHLAQLSVAAVEIRSGETRTLLRDIHASLDIDPRLRVHSLEIGLAEPRLRLQARGEVGIDEARLPLAVRFEWQGELPELGAASGQGRLEGDLAELALEHHLKTPYVLASRGRLLGLNEASGPRLELAGEWQALRWPLTGERLAASDTGRYRLVGPLQALALELDGDLVLQQYPRGALDLKATLYPDRVELASLALESSAGRLRASGRVAYAPGVRWDLVISGDALDPALLGEPWSGSLALKADASGHLEAAGPTGRVVLHRLEGVLREYPFSAGGEVLHSPQATELRGISIHSGDARLSANGRVMPDLGLDLSAAVPDLGQLWPGLAGALQGQAHIAGTAEQPRLKGEFSGSGIAYADVLSEQVQIRLDWPAQGAGEGRVRAGLSGLKVAGERWESAELQLSGTTLKHRLSADLRGGVPALALALEGGWDGRRWQGVLHALRSEGIGRGVWSNEAPARLNLSAEAIRVAPLCLVQASQRICLEGDWKAGGQVKALARLTAVDLANLADLLSPEYQIEGGLDGEARVSGSTARPAVQASLTPTDGRVVLRTEGEEEPLALRYSGVRMDLDYRDGAVQAEGGLTLEEQARVRVRVSTRPGKKGGADRLEGTIDATLPDLQVLAPLVPQARIIGGSATARLQIGGTLKAPRLSGEAGIGDTALEYPDLGLRLEAVGLQLSSRGDDLLSITGSARSGEVDGEGDLNLEGWLRLQPDAGWPFSLDLAGDRVVAVRLPDTRVLVSPDLRLSGNARALEVSGRVAIPEADIEVRELPAGAVAVSDDEVLLGANGEAESKEAGVKVQGRVALELGDKVNFKGFGLKTRLQGNLGLELKPGNTLASGSIDLREGRYKSWGQDLRIEQGRLLFAGPVDNPGIDLRALRLSNDGKVKAYLEVSGSLRKPVTRVRTEPPTSDTDALSYLLNGSAMGDSRGMDQAQLLQAAGSLGLEKALPALRAIQEESGLDELGLNNEGGLEGSALVAGKYLSPDLYVRYIQGLFDASAILSLRYRLSERLSVETRSGTTQSVELQYSFEHD